MTRHRRLIHGKTLPLAAVFVLVAMVTRADAAAAPTGSAVATNTLLSLSLGSTRIAAGIDQATSTVAAARSAFASMDFLSSGAKSISGGSRKSTSASDSGSDVLGTGKRTLGELGSLTVTSATLDASVATEKVSSATTVTMASLDLLKGLVAAGTAQTATTSAVTAKGANVARTVRLAAVQVLSIRELLSRLGIDPVALACSGVADAGQELGLDTGAACAQLAAVKSSVAQAQSALDAALAVVQADLAAAQATVAGLTLVGQPLADLASGYGLDWSGLLALLLNATDRDALIAAINARLTDVTAGVAAAVSGTCATTTGALSQVAADVPSLGATLLPLKASVQTGCDTLAATLETLLDTSLLTFDGLRVALTADAVPGQPFADGSGSIGTISVGKQAITVAGVAATSKALADATASARQKSGAALTALGIGAFPAPDIELLGVRESTGYTTNKTWFAKVSVVGAHVGLPAVPISLPSANTLAVLASSGSGFAAAPGPSGSAASTGRTRARAPLAVTPAIAVDAAVFAGEARFNAAGGDIINIGAPLDRPLANTGLQDYALMVLGLIALAAALILGRATLSQR